MLDRREVVRRKRRRKRIFHEHRSGQAVGISFEAQNFAARVHPDRIEVEIRVRNFVLRHAVERFDVGIAHHERVSSVLRIKKAKAVLRRVCADSVDEESLDIFGFRFQEFAVANPAREKLSAAYDGFAAAVDCRAAERRTDFNGSVQAEFALQFNVFFPRRRRVFENFGQGFPRVSERHSRNGYATQCDKQCSHVNRKTYKNKHAKSTQIQKLNL